MDGQDGMVGPRIKYGVTGIFAKILSFPLICVHLSRAVEWVMGANGGVAGGFGGDIDGFGGLVRGFGGAAFGGGHWMGKWFDRLTMSGPQATCAATG